MLRLGRGVVTLMLRVLEHRIHLWWIVDLWLLVRLLEQ